MKRILILGASGMIGSAMLRAMAHNRGWALIGCVRRASPPTFLEDVGAQWVLNHDLSNPDHLQNLFKKVRPSVVVNCAGLTKHLSEGNEVIPALTMNALLPNRLAELCCLVDARLIHISSDCVFSGKKGGYVESDEPDPLDVYGKTKHLGEVQGSGLVTLRTSTIGHEFCSRYGLLEWFLAQEQCLGFRKALFSGLTTVELAKIVRDIVIPNTRLEGLYHVGGWPIDKDALLRLISDVYGKKIEIDPNEELVIDRSLNSEKFHRETGYLAPQWPSMIQAMYLDRFAGGGSDV